MQGVFYYWNSGALVTVSQQKYFKKQLNYFILSSYSNSVTCSNKRGRYCFGNLVDFYKYIRGSDLNWNIQLNSVLYFFFLYNITWPGQIIKILLFHHPINHPFVCPGLFHSASFAVLFLQSINNCTYHMLESLGSFSYISIENIILYCCIISIVFIHM